MITMKGKVITLEPLDIQKHAKTYFEAVQDENIHRYTSYLCSSMFQKITE